MSEFPGSKEVQTSEKPLALFLPKECADVAPENSRQHCITRHYNIYLRQKEIPLEFWDTDIISQNFSLPDKILADLHPSRTSRNISKGIITPSTSF